MPFRESPKDIPDIPEPKNEVEQEQLDQSHFLFDQAEQRRVHLEQKAQSTFSLMTFLVPLLASLFVFLISKTAGAGTVSRLIVLVLLTLRCPPSAGVYLRHSRCRRQGKPGALFAIRPRRGRTGPQIRQGVPSPGPPVVHFDERSDE